jgi:regulatory protein
MAGTITALVMQKGRRKRVDVFLDGQRAFSLTPIEAARLQREQFLSDEDIGALQTRDLYTQAHEDALRYLSYRARSAAEMRRYLSDRSYPSEVVEAELKRLQEDDLINDAAFARAWVGERELLRPRSQRMLRQELRRKGLDNEAIASAVADVDATASAYQAARSRAERLSGLEYDEFRRKLHGFLARRGFSYEVTRDTTRRLWQETHGEAASETDEMLDI